MKIVITGGHLAPALAVIKKLPKDVDVIYVGRKYTFEGDNALSLEYHTITRMGISFVQLQTGRWQRKVTIHTLPSLLKVPYGFFQAFAIHRKFKPDGILSFGGYLSVPVCLAGFFLGIPIVIHEQTTEAGFANRFISFFAKKICISWKSSFRFFPKNKTILTGNPILTRQSEKHDCHDTTFKEKNIQFICIVGGSSGSHAINILVEGCVQKLLEKYNVLHQTGDAREYKDYERLKALRASFEGKLQERYKITRFIEPDHIACVLKAVDIVVSRSGINTITLLLFLKKPTILIPLPISQRNEQYKSAFLLKDAGLGEVYNQNGLSSEKLFDNISNMIDNKKRYVLSKEYQEFVDPLAATSKIIEIFSTEYEKNKKKKNKSVS